MDNRKKDAPSAAATALGANVEGREATGQMDHYHLPRTPRKGFLVRAKGPDGQPFTVTGQTARTLLALIKAGAAGVTALEIASGPFGFRTTSWSCVTSTGWLSRCNGRPRGRTHGRYVLRSTVSIVEVIRD